MSNNERKRKGLPMVRRRQHLRSQRNQKQRRKNVEVKYKPGIYVREEKTSL